MVKVFCSALVKKLKSQPSGEDARRMIRLRMRQQLEDPLKDPMTERLLPILKEYSGRLKDRVLDVGCYTGFLYHFLGKPEGYTGIDNWAEVITIAKEFFPLGDFRACDLMNMTGEYDIVWSSQIVWERSTVGVGPAVKKMRELAPKRLFVFLNDDAKKISGNYETFGPLSVIEEGWGKN